MNPQLYYFGDLLAIATALTWAFAVMFYQKSSDSHSTFTIKIFHNVIAFVAFTFIAVIQTWSIWPSLSSFEWLMLTLSAWFGITLGDTFYLAAIKRVGAGTQALLDCLYSPIVIALALIFFDEKMSWLSMLGAALVISAILMSQRPEGIKANQVNPSEWRLGLFYGVLSQITMALCIILIKDLLLQQNVAILTAHRYLIGTLSLVAISYWRRANFTEFWSLLNFRKSSLNSLWGGVLGPFLATWFWFAGYKYTLAGRAAIYNQLSTIFILILAYFWFGEKLTPRRQLAVAMALVGGLLVAVG